MRRILGLAIGMGVTLPAASHGWGGRTHRWIAYQALRRCHEELGLAPEAEGAAWGLVARGAVAADGHGSGSIPTIGHILHPATGDRPAHGKGPEVMEVLMNRIAEQGRDPRGRLFDLGRLCHIASDLCQPQHTAGKETNPDEDRQHHHFEKLADRLIEDLAPAGTAPPARCDAGLDPGATGLSLAAVSHRDYPTLAGAYRAKHGATLSQVATRQILASIDATTLLWREAMRRRAEREGSWGALALAPWLLLWMGVFLLPRHDEDAEDQRTDAEIYREMWSDWKQGGLRSG